jgi:hypothetical protein
MYRCAALTAAAGRDAQYNTAVRSEPATTRGQLGMQAQRNKATALQSKILAICMHAFMPTPS